MIAFLNAQRKAYDKNPKDAQRLLLAGNAPNPPKEIAGPELAAWTAVVRVVFKPARDDHSLLTDIQHGVTEDTEIHGEEFSMFPSVNLRVLRDSVVMDEV